MPSQNKDGQQPLLSSFNQQHISSYTAGEAVDPDSSNDNSTFTRKLSLYRNWLQNFLSSRTQHFCIICLVSLDLLGIFADIFINLYTCEEGEPGPVWDEVRNVLGIAGLIFSCLFMVELILSVWAFGWRSAWLYSTRLSPPSYPTPPAPSVIPSLSAYRH